MAENGGAGNGFESEWDDHRDPQPAHDAAGPDVPAGDRDSHERGGRPGTAGHCQVPAADRAGGHLGGRVL